MEKELLTKGDVRSIGVALLDQIDKYSEQLARAVALDDETSIVNVAKRLSATYTAQKHLYRVEVRK